VCDVLGVDAELDGVPAHRDVGLGVAEWLAGGDAQLLHHEVHPRQHLRDGVLHLDAAVDLDEVVVPRRVDEELERPDVLVPGGDDRRDRGLGEHRRLSSSSAGDGASSRIFWWRRCTEQSRSPTWTPLP
jgi:hypothetical protein